MKIFKENEFWTGLLLVQILVTIDFFVFKGIPLCMAVAAMYFFLKNRKKGIRR